MAGVLLALVIPASTRIDAAEFTTRSKAALAAFNVAANAGVPVVSNPEQQQSIHDLERLAEAAQAPLQRIEHSLHGVVIFGIMPLFALANAGVSVTGDLTSSVANRITLGIVLGLVLGKPIGIVLFSWLAVRMRLAELPENVGWKAIQATGCLAGIGFTMSLFVTSLAFSSTLLIDQAKFGILSASFFAGIAGWSLLRRLYGNSRSSS